MRVNQVREDESHRIAELPASQGTQTYERTGRPAIHKARRARKVSPTREALDCCVAYLLVRFLPPPCRRVCFQAHAVGKIPRTPNRREGRETDEEVLVARAVDRVLRPLFPQGYCFDTQVRLPVCRWHVCRVLRPRFPGHSLSCTILSYSLDGVYVKEALRWVGCRGCCCCCHV